MTAAARADRAHAAPAAPARCAPDPAILRAIHQPEVALAVWTRANPCPQAMEPAAEIDTQLPAGCGPDALAALLAGAGYRTSVPALAADLALHLRTMADLAGAQWLRLRLDRQTGDGCRRFHADYVTLRLLVTYAGPGTQWRVGEDGPVNGLQVGDVAILKGRLLLDPPVVLHRSPPIAGRGIERVLLAIDPVANPDGGRAAGPHGLQLLQ